MASLCENCGACVEGLHTCPECKRPREDGGPGGRVPCSECARLQRELDEMRRLRDFYKGLWKSARAKVGVLWDEMSRSGEASIVASSDPPLREDGSVDLAHACPDTNDCSGCPFTTQCDAEIHGSRG